MMPNSDFFQKAATDPITSGSIRAVDQSASDNDLTWLRFVDLMRNEAALDREFQTNSAAAANRVQWEMFNAANENSARAADLAYQRQVEREDLAWQRNKEMYEKQRQDYLTDRGNAYQT
ncbi:MAG: hypothetical protein IJX80_05105 [Clostridia bacterium]|nr:hypothetical protein [Clostridia bacterium]